MTGFRQLVLSCALCASAGLAILGGTCTVSAPARAGATEPVCVLPDGTLANYCIDGGVLSANGRFVAFAYGDDVFVRDRQSGTTERVSVGSDGTQADGSSYYPAISANGRFVAFVSDATNLVPGDTNGQQDVFVRDRLKGATERVSVGPGGAQSNSSSDGYGVAISADGRFVAFSSHAKNLVVPKDTGGLLDVFVRDRQAGVTTRVSGRPNGLEADGDSGRYGLSISSDGRFVAFTSEADNLVPGDTNGVEDVFVHDLETGKTQRVSLGPGGTQANSDSYQPSISADGRFVAFTSNANNLVPGDTNGYNQDVFVRDRLKGTTELVSIRPNGRQDPWGSGDGYLSADGGHVAFDAHLMPHHFSHQGSDQLVRDRQADRTKVVRRGEDDCGSRVTGISPNGRYVTFYVECPYIVADGDQIFIYDRAR